MSIGRVGSATNSFLMPVIAADAGLGTALLFGLMLIILGYIIGLVLLSFENKAQHYEPLQKNPEATEDIN